MGQSISGNSVSAQSVSALAAITNLKKLCNHPDLVYDKITDRSDGFENAAKFMPDDYNKKYSIHVNDVIKLYIDKN